MPVYVLSVNSVIRLSREKVILNVMKRLCVVLNYRTKIVRDNLVDIIIFNNICGRSVKSAWCGGHNILYILITDSSFFV